MEDDKQYLYVKCLICEGNPASRLGTDGKCTCNHGYIQTEHTQEQIDRALLQCEEMILLLVQMKESLADPTGHTALAIAREARNYLTDKAKQVELARQQQEHVERNRDYKMIRRRIPPRPNPEGD